MRDFKSQCAIDSRNSPSVGMAAFRGISQVALVKMGLKEACEVGLL
jgi:hypothetical protein